MLIFILKLCTTPRNRITSCLVSFFFLLFDWRSRRATSSFERVSSGSCGQRAAKLGHPASEPRVIQSANISVAARYHFLGNVFQQSPLTEWHATTRLSAWPGDPRNSVAGVTGGTPPGRFRRQIFVFFVPWHPPRCYFSIFPRVYPSLATILRAHCAACHREAESRLEISERRGEFHLGRFLLTKFL